MKKLLMLSISLISTFYILGQDLTDALRYSMDEIQGTARFRAMSGAFGALGGDMSAVNINPAGSAIFNNSHASLSLGGFNTDNGTNYLGGINASSNTNLDLNQLGAAFVFTNTDVNSPWKKFTLGVAYDKVSNFENDWIANGINPSTSIVEYFYAYADGQRLDEISRFTGETIYEAYSEIGSFYGFGNQQAFLGYESLIIDPTEDTDENTTYIRSINGTDFNQQYAYTINGYNGKLAFNFATSYNDKFYLGLNLNSHFIDYRSLTSLNETNSNVGSSIDFVGFDNSLRTTGSGFSFQLGSIFKLTKEFRLGLSYNSPTWYRINEELTQYLETSLTTENFSVTINPNVTIIFPEYKLQTPSKLIGSLAYVFGKKGLLSFDYTVKDYSNAKFKPTYDVFFSDLNTTISNTLDTSTSYRLGGEYRYKQFSFRGGYRFEESPYKDDRFYGDLNGYSLGLGYAFGGFNLDFGFSQSERDINHQLYQVGLTNSAQIQSQFTDIILSLAFNI